MFSSSDKRIDALLKILDFPKVKGLCEDWDSMSQDDKRNFLEVRIKNLKELDGLTECGVRYFLSFLWDVLMVLNGVDITPEELCLLVKWLLELILGESMGKYTRLVKRAVCVEYSLKMAAEEGWYIRNRYAPEGAWIDNKVVATTLLSLELIKKNISYGYSKNLYSIKYEMELENIKYHNLF